MSSRSMDSLLPTDAFELESGLSLVSRVKLLLTIHRSDKSVAPIDEWQLKRSLIDYLRASSSITVPEDDLQVKGFKDLKKRKRDDPVSQGALFIRDLGFLSKLTKADRYEDEQDVKVLEKKFQEWKRSLVEKMNGIELNLEGLKFKLTVAIPASDDFDVMRKEWEEFYAFSGRGYPRSDTQQPDTIVLRGAPSRWFAEPRVSSKPSMLVTHTIFSAFGKIRNLDVAEDDDLGKLMDENRGDMVPGLLCKIVVRFEKHRDFYNALKVLCGRSLQKHGSQLKADYEVTWDKDGFFQNSRNPVGGRTRWTHATTRGDYGSEARRHQLHESTYGPDNAHSKRFKE